MSTTNFDPTVLFTPVDLTRPALQRTGPADDGFREQLQRAQGEATPAASYKGADNPTKQAEADDARPDDHDDDAPSEVAAVPEASAAQPRPTSQEEETEKPSDDVVEDAARSDVAPTESPSHPESNTDSQAAKKSESPAAASENAASPSDKKGKAHARLEADRKAEAAHAAETAAKAAVSDGKAAAQAGEQAAVDGEASDAIPPTEAIQTATAAGHPVLGSTGATGKEAKSKKGDTQADVKAAKLDVISAASDEKPASTSLPAEDAKAEAETVQAASSADNAAPATPRKTATNRRAAAASSEQAQIAAAQTAATETAATNAAEAEALREEPATGAVAESTSLSNTPSAAVATDAAMPTGQVETTGADRKGQSDATQESRSQQSERQRFVQRVAKAFEAMGDRNGSLRLRLSPPELGSLRLEIHVRGGHLTAQVEAETSTARNMLLDNLPALRDRLAQQDIKIDRFEVRLADPQRGSGASEQGLPQQPQGDAQRNPNWQPAANRGGKAGGAASASNATSESRSTVIESDRLNVVI